MELEKYILVSKRLFTALTVVGVVAIIIAKGAILISIEEVMSKLQD